MKKISIILLFAYLLCAYYGAHAVSLDGTVNLKYETANYTFANGDYARGFVRLNNGFTVPAGASVSFNVLAPIAGPINLNDTGLITLEGDMTVTTNALVSGGIINGQGNTIFLSGDLTIPDGKVLEFSSSTVIDGQGHMLMLGTGAQLYVNGPAGTTLTLRNMSLHGVGDYLGIPSINFATSTQKLTLMNMKMFLIKNFTLWSGVLDIYDDVKIYGYYDPTMYPALQPMLFLYQSPNDIIIHSKSTLFLDMTIGFIYNPLDSNNNHLKFIAPSSRLYLNGCTLFTSENVGLKLLKGHLVVDHNTTLQSDGRTTIAFQIGDQDALTHTPNNVQDAVIDILPGARFQIEDAFLSYRNRN